MKDLKVLVDTKIKKIKKNGSQVLIHINCNSMYANRKGWFLLKYLIKAFYSIYVNLWVFFLKKEEKKLQQS